MLVLEVTGSVQDFARAVARIDGLEFAGEEELEADDADANPEFYLLVPQLAALEQIVSLWEAWQSTDTVPRGFAPWRQLFLHLRSIRPWGPADRVSAQNREFFSDAVEGAPDDELIRVELELVFRADDEVGGVAEREVQSKIEGCGGRVIHSSRHTEFAYHAMLVDLPSSEIRRIVDLDPNSLAGADPISAITPQSVGSPVSVAEPFEDTAFRASPAVDEPIVAIFDAVPAQSHSLLTGRLTVVDPFDLESKAVGRRVHGTAMASIVLHGDLNDSASSVRRKVYFQPVMYAPSLGSERFDDDRLVVDVIVDAVRRMREEGGAQVIVVNLSLGDQTKPFVGKVSTWARALDYLAFTYGILFFVSAGNTHQPVAVEGFADQAAFLGASLEERASGIFRGVDSTKADRRILAPAESLNSLTIGAWQKDSCSTTFGGASPFMPYFAPAMPNLSSCLGPGIRRSTKPEVLLPGGSQPVRLSPVSVNPVIECHPHPSQYWGVKVASPEEGRLDYTMGTSAAAALATHSAHRVFDALEFAYPAIIEQMPLDERAVLLKALLVHSAAWRGAEEFIRSIVDPMSEMHHEHWRREVCRHLGYGFVDPEDVIACASDRATMWATGRIGPEGALAFELPLPAALSNVASRREIKATLAWFTPVRHNHLAYRAVKLRIPSLQGDELEALGVSTSSGQPTNSQSDAGTVSHRRWSDSRIGGGADSILVQVQREKDQGVPLDEAIPFAIAVTLEMPGVVSIYDEVAAKISVKPRQLVPA